MGGGILRISLQAEPTEVVLVPSAMVSVNVFSKGVNIMFRKIAIAVGAVLIGLVVVCYTSLPSLVQVKWHDSMAWLDRQVPIETQIKQLKLEAGKIDNEIKSNIDKLAKMEVDTRNVEQQVVALREEQGKNKEKLLTMKNALETDKVANRNELRSKTNALEVALSSYEVKKAKLATLENLLAAKRQTVDAGHQKIAAMKEQRDELYVTIAKLENKQELVSIKTQQSTIEVSDSKIVKCRELAKHIDDLLTEQDIKADMNRQYFGEEGKIAAEKDINKEAVLDRAKKILEKDGSDQ